MRNRAAEEEAQRVIAARLAVCAGCDKRRWAPRVPEAFHGWVIVGGYWFCPGCAPNLGEKQ